MHYQRAKWIFRDGFFWLYSFWIVSFVFYVRINCYFHQLFVCFVKIITKSPKRSVKTPESSWIFWVSADNIRKVFDCDCDVCLSSISVVKFSKMQKIVVIFRTEHNDFFIAEESSEILWFLCVNVTKFKPCFVIAGVFLQVFIETFHVIVPFICCLSYQKKYLQSADWLLPWIEISFIIHDKIIEMDGIWFSAQGKVNESCQLFYCRDISKSLFEFLQVAFEFTADLKFKTWTNEIACVKEFLDIWKFTIVWFWIVFQQCESLLKSTFGEIVFASPNEFQDLISFFCAWIIYFQEGMEFWLIVKHIGMNDDNKIICIILIFLGAYKMR